MLKIKISQNFLKFPNTSKISKKFLTSHLCFLIHPCLHQCSGLGFWGQIWSWERRRLSGRFEWPTASCSHHLVEEPSLFFLAVITVTVYEDYSNSSAVTFPVLTQGSLSLWWQNDHCQCVDTVIAVTVMADCGNSVASTAPVMTQWSLSLWWQNDHCQCVDTVITGTI